MPEKMPRSDPRPSVRVTRGVGSGEHLASVLQECRENANIDAGLGFIRRISASGATLLALLLVFVRPALGDPCVLTVGSLYQLKSETVDWTMQTSSGQSCIRGLRHKRVTIDSAKLISPPQSGQVKLLGPGFSYTAKSDFQGQDSFTVQVSGMLNGIRGSSDIRIIVSVGPNVSPQTSPTERRDRPPGDLSSAGQPNQNPTAQGTDQTRQVRLADADASMDPSIGLRGYYHRNRTADHRNRGPVPIRQLALHR